MSILVTDDGFSKANCVEIEYASDVDPDEIDLGPAHIAIRFDHFADGRGFGIARVLRRRGYKGVLRAKGHVLSDQYAMARRVGFDEVEISHELAQRQGEAQWLTRANWQEHDYQTRLGMKK